MHGNYLCVLVIFTDAVRRNAATWRIFVVCFRVLTGVLIGAERTITMYVLSVADALTVIQYGVVFCLLLDCNKCSVAAESVTFLFI